MKKIIAWDLGATKCKAGLVEYHPDTGDLVCTRHHTIKLTDATSLINLIRQLEAGLGMSMRNADAICIGAAGKFDGDSLYHVNPYPFQMRFGDIAKQQQWPSYTVIHDYASIVCATFTSLMNTPGAVLPLNHCGMNPHGRRVAFGIGTGLGLKDGVILREGGFWLGHNEIGHIGIPTPPLAKEEHLQRHQAIMRFLGERTTESITFEKILSGQGTTRLYEFFHPTETKVDPEYVGEQMRAGKAPELVDAFAWYAGLFVGTIQLSFMPEGGIWITGGVALNHINAFQRPDFTDGIQATPAYLQLRQEFPLGVLRSPDAALIGCGFYAVKKILKQQVPVPMKSAVSI